MHKLYELKDKLMNELEDYSENGKFSKEDVESIKYITSAVDHIDNICEREDDMSYDDGMGGSYRGYSREGGRGGSKRGRYSGREGRNRRESRRRYSGADGMEDIESVKAEMRRLADQIEQM